jgi:hypothetical protein
MGTFIDDNHVLIDNEPQEPNDAIQHTSTDQQGSLVDDPIKKPKIASFLPRLRQDGAATPERPTPEPLTPEPPTPVALALTATSTIPITKICPPRMGPEIDIFYHAIEAPVTSRLADVVEDFDLLHTPHLSDAYNDLEISGEMIFDGPIQQSDNASKD